MKWSYRIAAGIAVLVVMTGCTALNTFTLAARPGDTVALATGWNQAINRNNLTAVFTDSAGNVVTYAPGSAGIRSVVQLYPDPVSKLNVEYATGQSNGSGFTNGPNMGNWIDQNYTNNDADWNQTVVYLDLPATLATGMASIALSGPNGVLVNQGASIMPFQVNVLAGAGTSNLLGLQGGINVKGALPLMERRNYYTVTFNSAAIPDTIQVNLTHAAGTAKPWVVNTRGDLKNVAWRDDGATNLRVMLAPSHGVPLTDMSHFKFYVASGIPLTGLAVASIAAYDASGYPISGVTANVSFTQ